MARLPGLEPLFWVDAKGKTPNPRASFLSISNNERGSKHPKFKKEG
jgi:hypothetical protein